MRQALLAVFLSAAAATMAADQAQWGERFTRNMASSETGLPDRFDPGPPGGKELVPGVGVRWVADLGTRTYATPIVAGGRVYIGTNNGHPRNPKVDADRGALYCFDERSGKFLWQLLVPKLREIKYADNWGIGITSTAAVEDDRVYLVTNHNEVACLDAKGMADGNDGPFRDEGRRLDPEANPPLEAGPTDADIIWLFDMSAKLNVHPHDASASSILILGDLLYVITCNGLRWTHADVPQPGAPNLLVFDKRTGELLARDDFGIGDDIVHNQTSAPAFGEVNGQGQVFFAAGNGFLYGLPPFDPASTKERPAKLKYLWKFHGEPRAQKEDDIPVVHKVGSPNFKPTANPVFYQNKIYLPFSQEPFHRTKEGWMLCINPTLKGDVTRRAIAWSFDRIGPTASTVAIADGLVYTSSFAGKLYCLDAKDGRCYWEHEIGPEVWGSPLVADGKIYLGNTEGTLWILKTGKERKVLSRIEMPDTIHGTITAANGTLFIATNRHLFAVGKGKNGN